MYPTYASQCNCTGGADEPSLAFPLKYFDAIEFLRRRNSASTQIARKKIFLSQFNIRFLRDNKFKIRVTA